jgi:hypothetical protein
MMKDSWVFQRRIFSEISRICLIRMQTYFHSVRELLQLVKVESRRSSEELEMKVEAISVYSQPGCRRRVSLIGCFQAVAVSG